MYCLNGFETVPNIVICDKYHFKLYLIWIASLSTMQLIQKKSTIWKYYAGTKQTNNILKLQY